MNTPYRNKTLLFLQKKTSTRKYLTDDEVMRHHFVNIMDVYEYKGKLVVLVYIQIVIDFR
jgi:hypothetical protein